MPGDLYTVCAYYSAAGKDTFLATIKCGGAYKRQQERQVSRVDPIMARLPRLVSSLQVKANPANRDLYVIDDKSKVLRFVRSRKYEPEVVRGIAADAVALTVDVTGRWLAVGSVGGVVQVLPTDGDGRGQNYKISGEVKSNLSFARTASPTQPPVLAVGSSDGSVHVLRPKNYLCCEPSRRNDQVVGVAVPNPMTIAAICTTEFGWTVTIWDATTGAEAMYLNLGVNPFVPRNNRRAKIEVIGNRLYVVTGSWLAEIDLVRREMRQRRLDSPITSLLVDDQNSRLYIATWEGMTGYLDGDIGSALNGIEYIAGASQETVDLFMFYGMPRMFTEPSSPASRRDPW